MLFNMSKEDIKIIIDLIDNSQGVTADMLHIKNLLLNRRGSKSYTKPKLIKIILQITNKYEEWYLKELSDKELYQILLNEEERLDNE